MDDATLITAHLHGDSHAMSQLMNRHRDSLMGFLVNRVGAEAEDLHQEVWVRVSSALPQYSENGTFTAWVFQIARRLVTDHYRRTNSRIRMVFPDDPSVPSQIDLIGPDADLQERQVADTLHLALANMKPEIADVIRWRLFEQTPFKEIAHRQNVSLNTALGRMHNGLKKIRSALETNDLVTKRRKP
ncbi:MAG: RNA polymerase sigma factor [Myxococcota bacterium]